MKDGYIVQDGVVIGRVFGGAEDPLEGQTFVPCRDVSTVVIGAPAPDPLVPDARDALARSDMVAMRCLKAGVAFPPEWQDYVVALRVVLRGDSSAALPDQPAFPEGT